MSEETLHKEFMVCSFFYLGGVNSKLVMEQDANINVSVLLAQLDTLTSLLSKRVRALLLLLLLLICLAGLVQQKQNYLEKVDHDFWEEMLVSESRHIQLIGRSPSASIYDA